MQSCTKESRHFLLFYKATYREKILTIEVVLKVRFKAIFTINSISSGNSKDRNYAIDPHLPINRYVYIYCIYIYIYILMSVIVTKQYLFKHHLNANVYVYTYRSKYSMNCL